MKLCDKHIISHYQIFVNKTKKTLQRVSFVVVFKLDSRQAKAFAFRFTCKQTCLQAKERTTFSQAKRVSESSAIPHRKTKKTLQRVSFVVGDGGFGPPKSVTTDLQSAPFGRSGNPPYCCKNWSWRTESNHQPADYKSAALPLSHASIFSCNGAILS